MVKWIKGLLKRWAYEWIDEYLKEKGIKLQKYFDTQFGVCFMQSPSYIELHQRVKKELGKLEDTIKYGPWVHFLNEVPTDKPQYKGYCYGKRAEIVFIIWRVASKECRCFVREGEHRDMELIKCGNIVVADRFERILGVHRGITQEEFMKGFLSAEEQDNYSELIKRLESEK